VLTQYNLALKRVSASRRERAGQWKGDGMTIGVVCRPGWGTRPLISLSAQLESPPVEGQAPADMVAE